jgi:phosphate transport system permease protein
MREQFLQWLEKRVPARSAGGQSLARRHRREWWFQAMGIGALVLAGLTLLLLLGSIFFRAGGALVQTHIALDITFTPALIAEGRTQLMVREALEKQFPDAVTIQEKRELSSLISRGAKTTLLNKLRDDPSLQGQTRRVWLPASSSADRWVKGQIDRTQPEYARRFSDRQIQWMDSLAEKDQVERRFNSRFFSAGDSREPELAGAWGSMAGSLLALLVCVALAFPIGVMAAVYLQEFAPSNRFTDIIEITINNLAAVPSILFGLLGLAVYLHFFGLPRSSALVGGLTLALMILPTIILSTRTALRSVPESLRDGARALGATPMQVVLHHVLPSSLAGIMTGVILGVARAIGETAPLLMIGMVAFVADVPGSVMDSATAMPVQIYIWSSSPETAFAEKTALLILLLLLTLMLFNACAVWVRKKCEKRW